MSREGKLAKNTLILSIGTFLPKLAAFITLPILTGLMTKEDYGIYDLITVLVSLLLPAVTLQIQLAAFRFLIDVKHDKKETNTIITSIYAFIIPTSVIALIVLYFCLFRISFHIRILICLYFLADIFVNAARQVCRGIGRTFDYSISAIISAGGKIVFVIICVYYLRWGLFGAVISLFIASLISFIFIFFRIKLYQYIGFKYFSSDKLKEMLKYSWPMVPNSMSSWIMRVSDRLVVTVFMGLPANAVYAVANKIPSLLSIIQGTFTLAWQENASSVTKDSDVSDYYSSMFKILFDFLTGCFCLLIAVTPVLFKLLIRGDYSEAYYQMPILFVAMFFLGLSTYLGGIFIAFKRTKSIGITTMIAAAINLLVDVGLINYIGLYAASGSTLVSYLFLFIFRIITVQKIVKVNYILPHMFIGFALIILTSVLCFFQSRWLNVMNIMISLISFWVLNYPLVKAFWRKGKKVIQKRLQNK